jgi:hypothetical protein
MTEEDDYRIVFQRIKEGIITLEAFLGFLKEEKAQSYISGVIRGSHKGELE